MGLFFCVIEGGKMGRIFVTGDKHGVYESLSDKLKKAATTTNDVVVVLGDNGTLYHGGEKDRGKKKLVSNISATFILLRGNHDKRPSAKEYNHEKTYIETREYAGVFYVDPDFPNVLYTLEYGWYRFGHRLVFVICGAYSVDKYFRLKMQKRGYKHYLWFEDEQLSQQEQELAEQELKQQNMWPFDIMSHTVPLKYKPTDCLLPNINQETVDQSMEEWLDELENKYEYVNWYCGHWHINRSIDRIRFLYDDLILYDEVL